VLEHRLPVAVVLLVVCLVSAVVGLPPAIEPNLLRLLPEGEPSAEALQQLAEEGGINLTTVALASDDDRALASALEELSASLEPLPEVAWVLHEVDETLATRVGLLRLDPTSVEALSDRVAGALLLGPAVNPGIQARLMDLGPLEEGLAVAAAGSALPGVTDGGSRLLIKPAGDAMDPPFAQRFVGLLDERLDATLRAHPEVRLTWVGGAYRHNVEDMQGIQSDLVWTSAASVGMVLLVVVVAFRGWRAPLLVFVPLVGANLVNLALVAVFVGSLNTYTSFGTAILFGLGIDFAVHLVGRVRELRAAGRSQHDAIIEAWDRTGPPCMTAALTSAAGFLALTVADFRGFSQLGLILAAGLMLCLFAMLVGLPLLLTLLDRTSKPLFGTVERPHSTDSRYALAPVGLMVAVLVTGVLGAALLPKLSWEYDFSALRRDGLAYAELTEVERAMARESYTPVVVRYPDAAARDAAVVRITERLPELPHVQRVVSVRDVVPAEQPRRLAALRRLQEQLSHPNARYLPPPLLDKLAPLRTATLAPVHDDDLPLPVRDLLGVREGEARLLLVPQGNLWDLRQAADLQAEVVGLVDDPRQAASQYVALGALYRHISADMPKVGLLAVLLVALLCAIDLRRPHWIATALGVLAAGMVWAGSALQLLGVQLTVMNVVGVPILLGIGVDVVIHLLHRLADEGPGGVRRALLTTGVAASISTLTTIASFASLTLAGSRGVRGMGLLVVVGLVAVFTAAAVLLPTAWASGWKVSGRAPGDR
jgi:predicted RND superfamily exporter protein